MNYNQQNEQLKGIRSQRAKVEQIVAGMDFNNNCIITGGMDVNFTSGANVANRKIILENVVKRLIIENKQPIVIFYKSPYLINRIISWYQSKNIQRECNLISGMIGNGTDNRCLAPFKGMNKEEIIYVVRAMSVFMELAFDQYSETFLEYLLNVIEKSGYEVNFENVLLLSSKSDEELTLTATALELKMERKFFAKSNNGAESVRRILKEMNNYFQFYYQKDFHHKINICSEMRANHVLFIRIDDQYQKEMLQYFCNELKCCSQKCPYIVFDDILLKNNPDFEDYLLQSTGLRFCISAMDVSVNVGADVLDHFLSQTQTKFLLHYDNANAAEKITSSVGAYYHLKVSEEESANRETFKLLNSSVSKGISVTDEKRLIIEGTDLVNLTAAQMYVIDSNSGRIFIDGLL